MASVSGPVDYKLFSMKQHVPTKCSETLNTSQGQTSHPPLPFQRGKHVRYLHDIPAEQWNIQQCAIRFNTLPVGLYVAVKYANTNRPKPQSWNGSPSKAAAQKISRESTKLLQLGPFVVNQPNEMSTKYIQ